MQFTDLFSLQKMWIRLQFVNLNLMLPRLNNSKMQLRIVTGLNFSWVSLYFHNISFSHNAITIQNRLLIVLCFLLHID